MMYKLLCLSLCLAFAAVYGINAYAEDLPPETSDILLIYDGGNLAVEEEDVELFCELALSMGKSLTFGDIKDFKNSLSKYDYVICYRMEDVDAREMRAVKNYKGNLMVLGSDFMARYLRETGQADLILLESDQDRGVLRYDFSLGASFEEIVDAENIALFQSENDSVGTVTVDNREDPFYTKVAGVSYTPVTSISPKLVQAALMREITFWMWPYGDAPPDYGQYLVLDSIYPFMDPDVLLKKVDALIDEEIPFVLSVMPIYDNVSYPAMVQFCQILQYAQQQGGFIIMHAPIVHSVLQDTEEVYKVLTDGLTAYINNGVYPLGIEAPVSWIYDDFYLDILKRYRTVFLEERGDEDSGFSLDIGCNKLYYNYHQLVTPVIALDKTGASYLTCYSSAIYLDSYDTDVEQIHEAVDIMKSQRVPFQNLWELNHSVWANELHLSYENKTVYINDEMIEMTYEPVEYDEKYEYNRDIIKRITVSIQNQNKMLMIITIIVVIMFAAFMMYLRKINKQSFFYEDD